jgi:hypothetical protein
MAATLHCGGHPVITGPDPTAKQIIWVGQLMPHNERPGVFSVGLMVCFVQVIPPSAVFNTVAVDP